MTKQTVKAIEGELISPEDEAVAVVKAGVQSSCDPAWIARQIGMKTDDYLAKYADVIDDALNEMQVELAAVMKAHATGQRTAGNMKAAAYLLDRLGYDPAGKRVIGARNQTSPIVVEGEVKARRKPVVNAAIMRAIEAERKD